jgi:hypothetical protein
MAGRSHTDRVLNLDSFRLRLVMYTSVRMDDLLNASTSFFLGLRSSHSGHLIVKM